MTDEAKKLCERARERYQKGLALLMEMGPEERAQIRADIARIDRIERLTTEPSEDRVERVAACPDCAEPCAVMDLVAVFRRLPLHGDAGCDKLTDDEWCLVARTAIATLPKGRWNEAIEAAWDALLTFQDYAEDMERGYLVGKDGTTFVDLGTEDLERAGYALAKLAALRHPTEGEKS